MATLIIPLIDRALFLDHITSHYDILILRSRVLAYKEVPDKTLKLWPYMEMLVYWERDIYLTILLLRLWFSKPSRKQGERYRIDAILWRQMDTPYAMHLAFLIMTNAA